MAFSRKDKKIKKILKSLLKTVDIVKWLWYYIWAVAKDGKNIDNRIVKAKQQKRIFTQKSILETSQKMY